jgi:hypothetical protein
MQKAYKNRAVTPDETPDEVFFFPKHSPPVSIRAKSREDAEEKLKELDNANDNE